MMKQKGTGLFCQSCLSVNSLFSLTLVCLDFPRKTGKPTSCLDTTHGYAPIHWYDMQLLAFKVVALEICQLGPCKWL